MPTDRLQKKIFVLSFDNMPFIDKTCLYIFILHLVGLHFDKLHSQNDLKKEISEVFQSGVIDKRIVL